MLDRSVSAAARHSDGVVVVVPSSESGRVSESLESSEPVHGVEWRVVAGGSTRSGSVRSGLGEVPGDVGIVLVHDAARPLASDAVFENVISAVRNGAGAAIPVIAVTDSIRHRDGGVVDRDQLVAVQTPQAFSSEVLRQVHRSAPEATDDAALVSAAGGAVELVEGEPRNLKLTTPYDLEMAALLLAGDS